MPAKKPPKEQPSLTFTDQQVTGAAGLHLDNLRRLITWGAVKPIQAGGGRGRVRMWTARQALRISVTAQFVEAGFSLQMAHTLTYCIPLDDLLYVFDPEMIRTKLADKSEPGSARLKAMISADGTDYWPDSHDYLGSLVLIVDRRYLYADVLGGSPILLAVIDPERQCVYPGMNPYQFQYGSGMAEEYGLPTITDAKAIDRASLLIEDKFLTKSFDQHFRQFHKLVPRGLGTMVIGVDSIMCKNLYMVNLAVGLTDFVRKLLGLPVDYRPFDTEYDD